MQRVVNLHPAFFEDNELSMQARVSDIAYDGGFRPFRITLTKGGDEVYFRPIQRNEPTFGKPEQKVDERKIKRDLRREFKRKPFLFCSPRLSYINFIQ